MSRLIGVLALSLAASLLGLVQPWLTKLIIDDGLLAGDFDMLLRLCGLMLVAGVIAAALSAFNRWHYVTASGRVLFALRANVYRHLQGLSPTYYANARTGDLMTRLDGDVAEVQRFCVDSALALVNAVIVLVGALALMALMSWQLSLVAFCLLPLQVLLLRTMRPRIETATRDMRERTSGIASFLHDTLSAMKLVQTTGNQMREAVRLDRLQDTHLKGLRRLQMLNQASTALPSLLTLGATIAVFLIGGSMVIAKTFSLGSLVAFTAYMARATGPVHTLLGLWVALKRAEVSLGRVHDITSAVPAVRSPDDPSPRAIARKDAVVFDTVSFSYPDTSEPVLRGVDVVLPGGSKTVVMGASGAGKTTFIDLLQRHYDPDAGRILIEDTDLRHFDLGRLRTAIGVVAQETMILAGTIADNIRYAAPEADDNAVEAAARRAGADTFIDRLPDRYDTDVGSRGLKLSGGQRQRIALARALLQDPQILVLDEATSGVDTAHEHSIAEVIDALFADRTRIVIGHRSTLTENADLVIELDDGQLTIRDRQGAT